MNTIDQDHMSISEWMQRKREQTKRNRYHENIEWNKVKCQNCGKVVEYVPKEGWDGRLRCPHCGEWFRVPRLEF